MIGRTFTLATALFAAFLASQAPEFAQQYRQRLGGAVDELARVVADFDRDAKEAGLDRNGAVAFMKSARETLIHLRGISIEAAIRRYDRLRSQQEAFERSGPIGKVEVLVASPDKPLVNATLRSYAPAVPTTPAGLVMAAAGFLAVYLVYLLLGLIALPFRLLRIARRKLAEEEPF